MKWINVNDRLPEENKEVLVYPQWDDKSLDIMAYCNGQWYDRDGYIRDSISFWHSLPESPEK